MAVFTYEELKKKYEQFALPVTVIKVNGKSVSEDKAKLGLTDIEVEMSCGFEASIATFWLMNCYNQELCQFEFEKIKKYIFLGSSVVIYMGYGSFVREVFRGFISRVNFSFQEEEIPGVEITAMDVKGIMMANNYSRQLKATVFSEAVKEILEKTAYAKLRSMEIITDIKITDTPDKQRAAAGSQENKASDRTIEMVCESDYEFVVKAAKKYNYEFFSVGGKVYFRKAKANSEILMELSPATGMHNFHVEYDITGLVEKIEVRGMDAGKAKLISAAKKNQNKISQGNKAKPLLKASQKVYIDPTISSKQEAEYRANYLMEDMSYRLGTLEAEFIGLPEITPGRYIKLAGLGTAASNTFYVTSVRHIMSDRGYVTKVTGKAARMDNGGAAGAGSGGLGLL